MELSKAGEFSRRTVVDSPFGTGRKTGRHSGRRHRSVQRAVRLPPVGTFPRTTVPLQLRPHHDNYGNACHGRAGRRVRPGQVARRGVPACAVVAWAALGWYGGFFAPVSVTASWGTRSSTACPRRQHGVGRQWPDQAARSGRRELGRRRRRPDVVPMDTREPELGRAVRSTRTIPFCHGPDVVPAENHVRAGQAACSYSCRRPPRRPRRRMRSWVSWSRSVIGSGSGASGRALAMPWCGRCVL